VTTSEFSNFRKRIFRLSDASSCFHKNQDCSSKLIRAHSIQNNRILTKLAHNGEVLFFDFDSYDEPDTIELIRTGRKKATTFLGFCGHHDTTIFAPIENNSYQPGNKQQEFLFAYRALAMEHYKKHKIASAFGKFKAIVESGDMAKIQEIFGDGGMHSHEDAINSGKQHLFPFLMGTQNAAKNLDTLRDNFTYYLDKEYFHMLKTDVIVFEEEYHIAVSSLISIEYDFIGHPVNQLRDLAIPLSPTFLTIFPQDGKTYVLISYSTKDRKKFEFFKTQMLCKSAEKQKYLLTQLITHYVENIAISPLRWNILTQEQKDLFNSLFIESAIVTPTSFQLERGLSIFV
jgi:hypothetical protein